MKKLWVLLAIVFALLLAVPASAETVRVSDGAGLLSSREIERLEEKLEEVSGRLQMDVVIATVSDLGGEDPERFTEKLYDRWGVGYGESHDGVILLISMEDRDWVITATGKAEQYINRAARNHIGEQITPDLSGGNYYRAFYTFSTLCQDMVVSGESGNTYRVPFSVGKGLLIAAAVSVVIALITVWVMTGKLRSVRHKYTAEDYVKQDSLHITCARERFLYRNVTRTPKPEHNSSSHSGGGGVSHSSSHGKF